MNHDPCLPVTNSRNYQGMNRQLHISIITGQSLGFQQSVLPAWVTFDESLQA